MNKLSVYKQMTTSPADLFNILRQEIGVKTTCLPFAIKAMDALSTLGNLTESEATKAANVFLDNMQTLSHGGITADDYDKIDFVKRGKTITISARVEAFLRAAARKGYRITETIVAVPKEDDATTYFKENFYDGDIVYTLEDARMQGDRKITAERLVSGYFSKFICRLEVFGIKQNKRLAVKTCEMSNEDVLNASAVSEAGIFKTRWEEYTSTQGYKKRRKVITEELNTGSIWNTWTGEMVAKTVIRRTLKRVREVLPELREAIYAFDNDVETQEHIPDPRAVEIPMEAASVNLDDLTEQQKADVQEMYDLFAANPKLATDKAAEIISLFNGSNAQEIINAHYASIANIKRSKKLCPIIVPLFESGTMACSAQ